MKGRGTAWKGNLARAKKIGPKGIPWLVGALIVLSALLLAPAATPAAQPNALGPGSLDQPVGNLPQTGAVYNRTHWQVQLGDTILGKIVNATDDDLQGATEA